MTGRRPPRLALALLERVVPDSAPIAGDLMEDFERRQSSTWVWWQVLAATAAALFNRPDEIRPLRIVDVQPADAVERSRRMSLRFPPVNMSASPLNGVGGLGLVALALLLTSVLPGAWWVLLASMLAGVLLGVVMIAVGRSKLSFAVLMILPAALEAIGASPARAQGEGARPSFEVTSVKPNDGRVGRSGALQPGRFAQTSVTLAQLIRMAYGTKEVAGGPGWVDSDRFDVEGRAAFDMSGFLPGRDGSAPRVYVMLQRLLEDRFKLAVHKEVQERPVYALVVRRADQQLGPRLRRSAVDCEALIAATVQSGRPPGSPPGRAPRCAMRAMPGHLWGDSIDMSQLAGALSTDRIVLDRTSLEGRFNVELEWTPDLPVPSSPQGANLPAVDAPPSLFTAIQEQLGLKLESTNAPIEVLVVDHAEPPTAN